jgi:hypothetical protein
MWWVNTETVCPYCSKRTIGKVLHQGEATITKVIECEFKDRGCRRRFVVDYKFYMSATTFAIDGEMVPFDAGRGGE